MTLPLRLKIMRPMLNILCASWRATLLERHRKLFGNGLQARILRALLGQFPRDAPKWSATCKTKFKHRFLNENCHTGNQSGKVYEFAARTSFESQNTSGASASRGCGIVIGFLRAGNANFGGGWSAKTVGTSSAHWRKILFCRHDSRIAKG